MTPESSRSRRAQRVLHRARTRVQRHRFSQAFAGVGDALRRALARLRAYLPARHGDSDGNGDGARNRSLVSDILLLQLAFAFLISVLAIGGFWWTSTWVVEKNLGEWGERWIAELDNLGTPLYLSDEQDRFLRIENYVRNFSEISSLRYYAADGELIFSDFPNPADFRWPQLTAGELAQLETGAEGASPSRVERSDQFAAIVRLSKPIWIESMSSDDLLDFDPSVTYPVERSLAGFVELGLDFSSYTTLLNRTVLFASLLGVLILALLALTSGLILRRALRPLARLQHPLAKLAAGRTNFDVETSGHREIVAIANALNTTVTALKERDDRLWRFANFDPLTGLLNRHRFAEALNHELEHFDDPHRSLALLFVDLDQFKYVNDSLGHAAGDCILKQVAARLQAGVRRHDVVSRFGGDEFTILVRDVIKDDVINICETLIQDLSEHPFVEEGQSFRICCSIGVTMIEPRHQSPADLLAQADMACHEAKARGRNRFEFYKSSGTEMRKMVVDIGWSERIRKALKKDAFMLHYQPIADVKTGEISHYEALLRMKGNKKRLIQPGAFIPAASRFGLMADLDQWVIRNAFRQLARFHAKGDPICLNVNISGNIFEDTNLLDCIRENLEINSLSAESIVLEITEQVAVRNMMHASRQMEAIAKLGCRFAIDDFGAGYSSYSYLKSLPVEFIKIDGVFIKNLVGDDVDQEIVRSISDIAKAAGKQTIAEYVEDARTFDLLDELGVHYAQGFFIGKPAARLKRDDVRVSVSSKRSKRKRAG
jgi:diguanylate cyclase (GGDEF)-like protein